MRLPTRATLGTGKDWPMPNVPHLKSTKAIRDRVSEAEWKVRCDLAACYRLFAHFGLTDLIYNHITAKVPGPEQHFLINAYGLLYEEVTASSLHKIDIDGNYVLRAPGSFEVNPAGFIIHSAIHASRKDATCVVHTHSRATIAISAMECGLLPLSQSATFFHDKVSYHPFEGSAVKPEERARLVNDLRDNNVMLLRNHGTLIVGQTVQQAFLMTYQFENACRIQVDAMAGGKLILPTQEICETGPPMLFDPRYTSRANLEWQAMLRLLDRISPGYAE